MEYVLTNVELQDNWFWQLWSEFVVYLYTCMYSDCFDFADKPEVRIFTKRISQNRGKDTIISCKITSSPRGVSLWRKGAKTFSSKTNSKYRVEIYDDSPKSYTLDLWILRIEGTDYGKYTCYAENRLGNDSETMILSGKIDLDTQWNHDSVL